MGFLFGMNEMFWKSMVVMVVQLCECTKNPWIVCFKRVSIRVCELHFNLKNRPSPHSGSLCRLYRIGPSWGLSDSLTPHSSLVSYPANLDSMLTLEHDRPVLTSEPVILFHLLGMLFPGRCPDTCLVNALTSFMSLLKPRLPTSPGHRI